MKQLADIIAEIIAAEKRREKQDAFSAILKKTDCVLTGSAALDDVRLKRGELTEYFTEHKN